MLIISECLASVPSLNKLGSSDVFTCMIIYSLRYLIFSQSSRNRALVCCWCFFSSLQGMSVRFYQFLNTWFISCFASYNRKDTITISGKIWCICTLHFLFLGVKCFLLALLVNAVSYIPFQLINVINLSMVSGLISRIVLHFLYITYVFCLWVSWLCFIQCNLLYWTESLNNSWWYYWWCVISIIYHIHVCHP